MQKEKVLLRCRFWLNERKKGPRIPHEFCAVKGHFLDDEEAETAVKYPARSSEWVILRNDQSA
jgi:hypothetical protein